MNDITQAAERLRQLQNGEAYWDIYAPLCKSEDELLDDHDANDRAAVIDAYLAEHASDDGELITEAWLDTINKRSKGSTVWDLSDRIELIQAHGAWYLIAEQPYARISGITTRGQLRLLLRALS